jgi:hypothetical protein
MDLDKLYKAISTHLRDTFPVLHNIDVMALEERVNATSSDIQQVKSHLEQSLHQVTTSLTTLDAKVDHQYSEKKTSFHCQNSVTHTVNSFWTYRLG